MSNDSELRNQLVRMLTIRQAHMDFEDAVADFPEEHINTKAPNCDYTFWHLLEHLRIAQWDILEFCRNPEHQSPEFPGGYWPADESEPDDKAWNNSVQVFRAELKAMQALVSDPDADITAPLSQGSGQTLLREVLLLADHNAYHLGQMVVLRRILKCWPR